MDDNITPLNNISDIKNNILDTTNNNINFNYLQIIANVIIQFLFVIIFLNIFFFTYVIKIERDIISKQTTDIITNIIDEIKIIVPQSIIDSLKKYIHTIPDVNIDETQIKQNNSSCYKKGLCIIIIISLICMALIFLLWKKFNINIKYLLLDGIISLIFVIITEIFFLHCIVKNFILGDSNSIKKGIFMGIQKFCNEKKCENSNFILPDFSLSNVLSKFLSYSSLLSGFLSLANSKNTHKSHTTGSYEQNEDSQSITHTSKGSSK